MMSATGREMKAAGKCLTRMRRVASENYTMCESEYRENKIFTIQTGIGLNGFEQTLMSFLTTIRTNAVVSLGFGGALTQDLHPGDIIICTGVASEENGEKTRFLSDRHLVKKAVKAADRSGANWIEGASVTVSALAAGRHQKQVLNEMTDACVCEMEDYRIARAAHHCNIPFIGVRVIFDALDDSIPDYERMIDRQGNISPAQTIKYFAANPARLPGVWRSFRNSLLAGRSLSIFTERFLNNLCA